VLNIRAVPDLLLGNPAGAGFVEQIRPEPDLGFHHIISHQ